MAQILVLYASDYGNTEKMAHAVAEGVTMVPGASSLVKEAENVTAQEMKDSAGFIFGSPVHMGSMDWRVKKFIDSVCSGLWMQNALNGKVAGVFVSGGGFGGAGGGAELAMLSIINNLAELGLLLVPLPKNTPGYCHGGLQWGVYGRSADLNMEHTGVTDEVLQLAQIHGQNIARAAIALDNTTVFESY